MTTLNDQTLSGDPTPEEVRDALTDLVIARRHRKKTDAVTAEKRLVPERVLKTIEDFCGVDESKVTFEENEDGTCAVTLLRTKLSDAEATELTELVEAIPHVGFFDYAG